MPKSSPQQIEHNSNSKPWPRSDLLNFFYLFNQILRMKQNFDFKRKTPNVGISLRLACFHYLFPSSIFIIILLPYQSLKAFVLTIFIFLSLIQPKHLCTFLCMKGHYLVLILNAILFIHYKHLCLLFSSA